MTLVIDRLDELKNKPAIHVLIAGVSAYDYLPGGAGQPKTEDDFGLKQLDSTARTANLICEWLRKADADGRLPLPIGTLQLLLSPSPAEADLPAVEKCSWSNFSKAAKAWRDAASRNNDNITFFYYAGHGIQLPPQRAILLMSDYGSPDGGPFDSTVDTNQILLGMAPKQDELAKIARTQFYFFDACRTPLGEISEQDAASVRSLWKSHTPGVDNRSLTALYGAPAGAAANALPGKQTLFSEALLECLDGLAAIGPEGNDPRWLVTSLSLVEAMDLAIPKVNEKYQEQGADQDYDPRPGSKALLAYLNEPPLVDVEVAIDPEDAAQLFDLRIDDDEENEVVTIRPIDEHPVERKLRAGTYKLSARLVQPPHPVYRNRIKLIPVKPPRTPWLAKVTS